MQAHNGHKGSAASAFMATVKAASIDIYDCTSLYGQHQCANMQSVHRN